VQVRGEEQQLALAIKTWHLALSHWAVTEHHITSNG
jgi:hypothetical protein